MKVFSFILLSLVLINTAQGEVFTFRADRMTGGRATGREVTILTGNAEVQTDNLFLQADRVEIHGSDNRFIECFGNVRGYNEEQGIFFRTDRLRYDRTLKIARLEGNSTMEDRTNEIVARARFIEYDEENEIAVMQISVRLFKDNLVCRAEQAVYNRIEQTLTLSGFPVVFKNDDEYRAERIRVDLETDDVVMEGEVRGSLRN
jgi:lipopolysaccharide export system protein LptA